jgi:hypothetical protein
MLLVLNYQATWCHVAAYGNIITAIKPLKSLIQYGYVTRLLLPITSVLKKNAEIARCDRLMKIAWFGSHIRNTRKRTNCRTHEYL